MTVRELDASRRRIDVQRGPTAGSAPGVLRGLLRGVVGGLLATALMTLYRFPVFRALPPTADFWAKYVGGGDAEAHPATGLLLHFLYGATAGGLFGVGISLVDFRSERERRLGVIGLSTAYGLALSAFGTRFLFPFLLDEELEPDEAVIFHVGHVVYGLTLGTWIGFRDRKGEVYE
ncbi:hypothetical protein U4E84_06055 [Halorubrum sp. AD140]|uniref:hypothetical protein n=1 Tax=Halorubrum sp. AD140 TaxID=3050073 RepID=UPI002ACCBD0F|nr:hypothetical protein [Halorubrum sp. AD140]MDZ5810905.1 hypothetical protein [Halorubrum sp. AD140]